MVITFKHDKRYSISPYTREGKQLMVVAISSCDTSPFSGSCCTKDCKLTKTAERVITLNHSYQIMWTTTTN